MILLQEERRRPNPSVAGSQAKSELKTSDSVPGVPVTEVARDCAQCQELKLQLEEACACEKETIAAVGDAWREGCYMGTKKLCHFSAKEPPTPYKRRTLEAKMNGCASNAVVFCNADVMLNARVGFYFMAGLQN